MPPRKCIPTDEELYEKAKKSVYKKIKTPSAYRSGHLVQNYLERFAKKHSSRKKPYKNCNRKKSSLKRWFKEDWKSDTGKTRYTSKSSVYRPTKRITKNTPTTFGELSEKEIRRAKREKRRTGRVNKFKSKSRRRSRRKSSR